MQTPVFYFSLFAFLISVASGIYFLAWWIGSRGRYRPLLYFAYGLGALLLFKIPNIVANAGVVIVQQDFYPFFFITLLLYFLAYIALMRGLVLFADFSYSAMTVRFFKIWFGAAVLYFAFSFFAGYELTYAPVWAGHLLFFIPAELLLFHELRSVARRPADSQTPISRSGAISATIGALVSVATSILYIVVQVWPYPRELWYFSAASSASISILQIASGLLFFFGLRAMVRGYFLNTGE